MFLKSKFDYSLTLCFVNCPVLTRDNPLYSICLPRTMGQILLPHPFIFATKTQKNRLMDILGSLFTTNIKTKMLIRILPSLGF